MSESPAASTKTSFGKSVLLWSLAFILMLAVAVYQRRTGPTYPMKVAVRIGSLKASGNLIRSHSTASDAEVTISADEAITGLVEWRKYPTNDQPQFELMARKGKELSAKLPKFPAAAKIEYRVKLSGLGGQVYLNPKPAILRYKDDVPMWTLILHLICIFGGLLVGSRAFIGALFGEPFRKRLLSWTVLFMSLGGLLFGPIMQKYAFSAYWTGWPLGEDLTDTKTLLSIVVWVLAWIISSRKPALQRISVVVAFIAMIGVYLIPHSIQGSQYDWSKQEVTTGR